MRIGIIDRPAQFSDYVIEFFTTWGVTHLQRVDTSQLGTLDVALTPVLLAPAGCVDIEPALITYAQRGAAVIAILPKGDLLAPAGLSFRGRLDTPTALRWTTFLPGGFRGETAPILGEACRYDKTDAADVLAALTHPHDFAAKSAGVTTTRVGAGTITCIAFDLPRCVMMMRQGDPAHAERVPRADACARPQHLAADFEAGEASWMPFADLLARALVELALSLLPGPAPAFSHLPAEHPSLVLLSGDEDHAPLEATREELDYVHRSGGRMDLYLIPDQTHSTRADVEQYAQHHDVGPHPNLRPLDGYPVHMRLAQLESQIRLFTEKFGAAPLTLRNHCTAWAGYMEHVEVLEKRGVKMDASYFPGRYARGFDSSPYGTFGAGMAVKFCRPDGRVLDVYQQHTAVSDDTFFLEYKGTSEGAHYSFNYSPDVAQVILERYLSDAARHHHVPTTFNLHPGGWVLYSRPIGQRLIALAKDLGVPVWSFTQWCRFLLARAAWRIENVSWVAPTLRFTATGPAAHPDLRLALPASWRGRRLTRVTLNGAEATPSEVTRFRQPLALLALPGDAKVEATYR